MANGNPTNPPNWTLRDLYAAAAMMSLAAMGGGGGGSETADAMLVARGGAR